MHQVLPALPHHVFCCQSLFCTSTVLGGFLSIVWVFQLVASNAMRQSGQGTGRWNKLRAACQAACAHPWVLGGWQRVREASLLLKHPCFSRAEGCSAQGTWL